ncbi:DUF2867 domain-containing protein [Pseudonocardia abyssalis]|jgi:hypothetical protein|uniref:DUF2867 domain-containing protein n=1 Tax=Pseudonocardia abyssalis TaxID=2792008 RepID=A0ABS6UWS8_9PSEU|nr:DUF2867 domain-containing protein [Pseudonocardia abyssalis]MBW0115484.1 DUF2867 domain-containing protein [Pseudonocardia abyssalis]MBW0136720.1 DUF2867 domain-containing protein [Pseudonocardia abyssalis]
MRNVHERVLAAEIGRMAPLLDGLGGPDDRLWPSPEYEPLRLRGPVAPGVRGTNGPVRLHVSAYEPGRRVELTTEPGEAIEGRFVWEVEPVGPGRTRIRQISEGRLSGALRWLWPLVRPQHDHCIESMFDRAEVFLGLSSTPTPEPPLARAMARAVDAERARAVAVPETPLLATALPRVDFSDAHAVLARPGMPTDPQVWADALFHDPPSWVVGAMGLREALVGTVGIARSGESTFGTLARTDDEVLLGSDEGHLDFRASVLREPDRVVVSTVVQVHNARGRAYFAPVRLVHPMIVRAMLTRAAHRLSRRARENTEVGS